MNKLDFLLKLTKNKITFFVSNINIFRANYTIDKNNI